MKQKLSANQLPEFLRYDSNTGKIYWLERDIKHFKSERDWKIWNTRYGNQEAFTATYQNGRRNGAVFGVNYLAHRVAWALHYGEWPKNTIDHINGDPSDNRICNLRDASAAEQSKNMPLKKSNKTGQSGVTRHSAANVWVARINCNGITKHIGSFSSLDAAIQARKQAESALGYHKNHGRRVI